VATAGAQRRPHDAQRAQRRHRRRTRLLPLAILVAAALTLGVVAGAGGSPGSGATASLAAIGPQQMGAVDVAAAATDNTSSTTAVGSDPGLGFKTGTASASSFLQGESLVSQGQAKLSDVSLLGGVVTADGVIVVAHAVLGHSGGTADVQGSAVVGLQVNGEPVDASAAPIEIPNIGTLTVLPAATDSGGDSSSAEILGLRLQLSTDWQDLPAGTVLVVGNATARADSAALDTLLPTPSPTPSPTPTKPKPSPTATPKPTPKPTHTSTPQPQPSTPQGPPPVQPAKTDYTMPPPQLPTGVLISFPGAVFPVLGNYYYTDDWHAPRVGHLHMGIDIVAAYGTPVVAVMDGRISSMAHGGAGGIDLFLTTARGDSFLYCHFSSYAYGLHVGQKVKAGQVIAYVGATGDATGPHLHFEIHPGGGAAINPFPYLELWRAQSLAAAAAATTAGSTTLTPLAPLAPLASLARGLAALASQPSASPAPTLTDVYPQENNGAGGPDPVSNLPLVVITAVGTAVLKRLQWGGRLL
jgi:murein DD-endopeptidase MepM/ murein hydrolase activator NlpD